MNDLNKEFIKALQFVKFAKLTNEQYGILYDDVLNNGPSKSVLQNTQVTKDVKNKFSIRDVPQDIQNFEELLYFSQPKTKIENLYGTLKFYQTKEDDRTAEKIIEKYKKAFGNEMFDKPIIRDILDAKEQIAQRMAERRGESDIVNYKSIRALNEDNFSGIIEKLFEFGAEEKFIIKAILIYKEIYDLYIALLNANVDNTSLDLLGDEVEYKKLIKEFIRLCVLMEAGIIGRENRAGNRDKINKILSVRESDVFDEIFDKYITQFRNSSIILKEEPTLPEEIEFSSDEPEDTEIGHALVFPKPNQEEIATVVEKNPMSNALASEIYNNFKMCVTILRDI